jgi:hypothetical protein
MPESIGPHLLGRNASPPDPRDWKLEHHLASNIDPLQKALANLQRSIITPSAVKHFGKTIVDYLESLPAPAPQPGPTPTPTPTPGVEGYGPFADISGGVGWADPAGTLDQGDTGHCVGFTGADFRNEYPVPASMDAAEGHRLYYACKVEEGEPKQENGAYVRSLMKVLKSEGTIGAYASTTSAATMRAWAKDHGPLCVGTNWYDGMFTPGADGVVPLTGSVAGGHAYTVVGDAGDAAVCMNHWGQWGVSGSGLFLIRWADMDRLMSEDGEGWAALEMTHT